MLANRCERDSFLEFSESPVVLADNQSGPIRIVGAFTNRFCWCR
jgi:hypothetical protein